MLADVALTPRSRPDVAQARVGNHVLLFEPFARRLHTLNSSAALVWRRLDGRTTLWDVAGQLAEVYAADRAVLERDVVAVVARFDALGLLAGDGDRAAGSDHRAEPVDPQAVALRAQLDERTWAAVSEVHQAVGCTFRVRSEDEAVAAELTRVLRSLRRPGTTAAHSYSIRRRRAEGAEQWRVYFDGTPLGTVGSGESAVALVLWHLNQAVVRHTDGALFFHAGGVQVDGRVVMLPASTDSGKSTLTTALVRRGLAYVTDAAVALDVSSGVVRPYPKAICLERESQLLFPDLRPEPRTPVGGVGAARWNVDPAEIPGATIGAGGRVGLVVSPTYTPGAATRVERVTEVDAVRLLLDTTFAFDGLGDAGFHALVALAQQSPVYRLQYGDLEAACEVVLELVREIR
jgi:hypothetical protein